MCLGVCACVQVVQACIFMCTLVCVCTVCLTFGTFTQPHGGTPKLTFTSAAHIFINLNRTVSVFVLTFVSLTVLMSVYYVSMSHLAALTGMHAVVEAWSLVRAHAALQVEGGGGLFWALCGSTHPWRRTGGWGQRVYTQQSGGRDNRKRCHWTIIWMNSMENCDIHFIDYNFLFMVHSIWSQKSKFPSSKWALSTGTPLNWDFKLGKPDAPHQPRPQNPRWPLSESTAVWALKYNVYCLTISSIQILNFNMFLRCLFAKKYHEMHW